MISPDNLDDFVLGEFGEQLSLDSSEHVNKVAAHMCEQTLRTFYVIDRDLDRKLYDQDNFSSALFALAKRGRFSDIRFLIHDSGDAARRSHEVARLAQRLSSYIQVRRISDEFSNFNEAYIIADKRGFIYRGMADRYDAVAEYHNPRQAYELQNTFEEIWAHSIPDPNFRQLFI